MYSHRASHHDTSRHNKGGIPNNNKNKSYEQQSCDCVCQTTTQSPPQQQQLEENIKCQQKAKSFEYELANGVAALISQSSILCLNCDKNPLKPSTEPVVIRKMSSNCRDRLGFWGTSCDNEVPGSVSGHDRLHKKRYNKVSFSTLFYYMCADYLYQLLLFR